MSAFPASIRCSFCGNTGKGTLRIPTTDCSQSLPTEDEISILQQEIQRIEQALAKLSQDRAALQRRLNVRCSPIYKLPAEILGHTFQFLIPGERDLSFDTGARPRYLPAYPRLLGEVSFAWRQIVVSTPQFWSTLIHRLLVDGEIPFAEALKLYLRHSETFPFHLELEVKRTSEYDLYGIDLRPIEGIIFNPQYAARFRSLHLINAPRAWGERIGTRGLFKSLTQFMWNTEGEIEEPGLAATMSLEHVTSLRHLISFGASCPFILPTSITILHLHAACPRTFMEILKQCHQLVEAYYMPRRCSSWHCDPHLYDNSTAIFPPSLRKFVAFGVHSYLWPTLNQLRLPAVEIVEIRFAEGASASATAACQGLLKFLAQLPRSVSELVLVNCSFPLEGTQMILQPLSGLQVLSFDGASRNVENVIRVLTPSASDETNEHIFPALRKLKLNLRCHQEGNGDNERGEGENNHWASRNYDVDDGGIIGSNGCAVDTVNVGEPGGYDDATLSPMELRIQWLLIRMLERRLKQQDKVFELQYSVHRSDSMRAARCVPEFGLVIREFVHHGKLRVKLPSGLWPLEP